MKNRFNLQYFNANESGAEDTSTQDNVSTETETGAETTKEPSFDDLLNGNKEFQSAFDKKVNQAIETAKSNWEKDKNKELEEAKSEAERLAKMSADEKAEHEREKREAELQKREAELNARELKQGAKDMLIEKNLPVELADLISYSNAEQTKEQIGKLEEAFNKAVENKVNERLKGKTPLQGGTGKATGIEAQIDEAFKNVK